MLWHFENLQIVRQLFGSFDQTLFYSSTVSTFEPSERVKRITGLTSRPGWQMEFEDMTSTITVKQALRN
jgi:hypothetical protein